MMGEGKGLGTINEVKETTLPSPSASKSRRLTNAMPSIELKDRDKTRQEIILQHLHMYTCTKISAMSCRILLMFLLARPAACHHNQGFTFPGQLKLDGVAEIDQAGVVTPLNATTGPHKGRVFYSQPFQFNNSTETPTFSFSTTFVFSLNFPFPVVLRDGICFFITPTKPLPQVTINPSLEDASPNFFSIGLGTKMEFTQGYVDANDTHLEIKINEATLIKHSPLGYYFADMDDELQKLDLTSEEPMQVWVEFDGREKVLNVTLAPLSVTRPSRPLLSIAQDLSPLMSKDMYVGISTYNPPQVSPTNHYILAWSFKVNNGQAQGFDRSQLQKFTPDERGSMRIKEWKVIKVKPICYCLENLTVRSFNSTVQHPKQRASHNGLSGKAWAA